MEPVQIQTKQQELIIKVCDDLKATLLKKDADYKSSFSDNHKEFGIISGIIQLTNKLNRLKNLALGNKNQVEESIDDTILDNAGYSILLAVERLKEKEMESVELSK